MIVLFKFQPSLLHPFALWQPSKSSCPMDWPVPPPLFIIPSPSGSSILTAPMLSATLKRLLTALKLNPAHYGFHFFWRSGVSWAVDNVIPLQNLELHGGWASDAINTYIKATPKASAKIPLTFQKLLL